MNEVRRMCPSANGGLTLVELLVIIAMIVILAVILAPTLTSTTDRSRMTACRGNLTHIGIAMRTYRTDHGDWPPNLRALHDAGLLGEKTSLFCTETKQMYFYLKPDNATPPGRFIVSCCAPSTPEGQRPHDRGYAFVAMKASGEVVEIGAQRQTGDDNDHGNSGPG